jgi:hypothetical protein
MRTKIIAAISVLIISLSQFSSGVAADFIDDQVFDLPMPAQEAGYLGAYVDDASSFRFSSFLIANDDAGIKNGTGHPCYEFTSADCAQYPRFTYNAFLPPCSVTILDDCITSITAIKADGTSVAGKLKGAKPDLTAPAFKGDPNFNMPDGWFPTTWAFDGITHQGGEDFLLRASIFSFQNRRSTGFITPQLRVAINAVSITPSRYTGNWSKETNNVDQTTGLMSAGGASHGGKECWYLFIRECAIPWSLPTDIRFKVELKTRTKVSGWVNGRLSNPNISVTPNGNGQAFSIEAGAMSVPVFAMWKKFSEFPKEFQDLITAQGGKAGSITFPQNFRTVYSGSGPEPFDKISANHWLSNYDSTDFNEFLTYLKYSDDKAIATKNLWHFESNRLFYQEGDQNLNACSLYQTGISGFVSTNSTMFMATPPKFNTSTQTLDYQVAAPHYDRNGKENIGRYNLVIDSKVARCLYKFSNAPIQASVSIVNADGTSQVSTSTITEKDGWLYLSVNGYTYSAPTLKIKLSQGASTSKALPPVMVNPLKAKNISVALGRSVVLQVSDPSKLKAKISNSSVARFVPGGSKGNSEANPSLKLLRAGKTDLVFTYSGKSYRVGLTVK